nr:putative ribonuclease H-like domain-containing protein [Tanacetum cinerariifolium]
MVCKEVSDSQKSKTWFDLFLKSDIDKDENHILGPSTVAIAKKFKELILIDELIIADFKGARLERLKAQYKNDVELKYHVTQLKASVLSEAQIPERWSKEVRCFIFEALNGIHHWEENRIDFFKVGMSAVTEGNIFSDLRIKSVVHIDVNKKWGYGFLTSIEVRRSDDKEYEFSYVDLPRLSVNDVEDMYLLYVQDKLHHLLLEFLKDLNNALLMFIRRTVIKNRVEDIQLGVESYQRTLNLTKPTMFFEGIGQRIPYTMTAMHKGSYHAGCNDDCKSTSGGIQFLGEKLISWSSKKQDCIAISTAKADYEHVERGTFELYFVGTKYHLAGLFTKALPKERFECLIHKIDTNGMIKVLPPKTAEEVVARGKERKARTTLLMALPEDHLAKFHKMAYAKQMWEAIKSRFGGNDESKKMQKYLLKQQFEGFSVSTSEGLHKSQSSSPQLDYDDLEEETDLKCCHKMGYFARDCRAKGNQDNRRRDDGYNGNKARDNGRRHAYQDDSKALVTIDGEDINWSGHVEEDAQNYAMMAYSSSNPGFDNESVFMNKESDLENTFVNDRYAARMHAVPPPMTGNYMSSGPDVEIDYSKFTYADNTPKVVCEPKVWTDAPIIEEYESDSDNDSVSNVQEDKEKPIFAFTGFVKHVKTLRENVKETGTPNHNLKIKKHDGNGHTRKGLGYAFIKKTCFDDPHRALKDKGIVDSGCSRHIIGNKAHLADYHEFKGGSVAFGGSNGRITGPKEANNSAGTQANDDQSANSEEIDLHEEHFVLPIWSAYSTTVKSSGDKIKKNAGFKSCDKPVSQVEQIFLEELEKLKRQEKKAHDAAESLRKEATYDTQNANTSSTNLLNTVSTQISIAGPSRAFNDGELSYADDLQCLTLKIFMPVQISQALEDESWVDVMQEELLQFQIQRGHRKGEGIDYDEVFALMARIEAIRIFLAFSSYMGFIVYQMHVKSAFMYGTIDEEVYVSQTPSFVDLKFPNKVYKVVKALYSLHQAPRAWYATLSTFLEKSRYRRGAIDKTLFIKHDKKDIMLVQVYVDDIIFGSTKKSWCDEFEELMKNRFQMSSMGELAFFLGLQVKQKEDGIFISQDKYVAEILKKFNFLSVKTASTPIETHKPLVKDEEAVDVDVHLYRYLKRQPKLGLWYPKVSSFNLEAYSNSDYAGTNLDRKSTTRGCQFLSRRLISWQCKKQTIVATSTIEAEYVIAAHCCRQVLWIQNQLLDYGFNIMNTKIYIDNESIICIVKNHVFYSKTKHIEIRHHFIRDAYGKKLIQVLKIHTNENVADLLTKAFDVSKFNFLFTMSNPHQELASLEANGFCKELASPKQTALGKDISNPFMTVLGLATIKNVNDVVKLRALTDGKRVVVTEDVIRQALHLDDVHGVEKSTSLSISLTAWLGTWIALANKISQALEIIKLKKRIKKLEKKRILQSSGLKRLRKVGTSQRVKSFTKTVMGAQEDASKQGGGKIKAIDADEDITLVDAKTQVDMDVELQGRIDDVSAAATKEVNVVEPTVFDDEEVTMTMDQTLIKMKAEKARILDEQIAKKLYDEEVEQAAAKEKQEKDDLEKYKGLQQQKYQSLKRKQVSIAQAKKNMIIYLKNMAGCKMEHFRGMTYDKVRPIFKREYNKVQTLFKSDKDVEELQNKKVVEETLLHESFKKLKAVEVSGSESTQDTPTNDPKEISEEYVQNMLEIVPVSEFKVEALQVKYPRIDWEIHSVGSRTYWKIIRVGEITKAYQSFEDMLKGFDREDLVAL